MKLKKIDIYTDGACSGNPGMGGYGAVLIYNGTQKQISGFEENTTNNRMELLAVIKALELVKFKCEVSIFSDSAYICNAFINNWVANWQKNDFIGSSKEEIKNKDLWLKLIKLSDLHKVEFVKVKGHSTNELNNLCDKLATDEIKKHKQEK